MTITIRLLCLPTNVLLNTKGETLDAYMGAVDNLNKKLHCCIYFN